MVAIAIEVFFYFQKMPIDEIMSKVMKTNVLFQLSTNISIKQYLTNTVFFVLNYEMHPS